MDDRIPLDRRTGKGSGAARATRSTQSTADEADKTHLHARVHPAASRGHCHTVCAQRAVENGDHYIRTLVGGSLATTPWICTRVWVVVLYLLLAYAALPVQGAARWPLWQSRGWCCAATVVSCLLAVVAACCGPPTDYETLYGLQGAVFPAGSAAAAPDLPAPPPGRPCPTRIRRSPT